MTNNSTPPFYATQKVVALNSFKDVRKIWGFNYPKKGDVVTVTSIRKAEGHNFWLITIPSCEVELCHKNFAPILDNFQSISLSKILEEETKLIGAN